ncbi:unnamed protein product [Spirodela intermedia]|uniref:Secreted protein n=1 Tax=Spirodela intermedia TaxID=51605 RepID=A0ABN7E9Y7_SPIIN|nr:unnamed protein product [Spirodela intermedia]
MILRMLDLLLTEMLVFTFSPVRGRERTVYETDDKFVCPYGRPSVNFRFMHCHGSVRHRPPAEVQQQRDVLGNPQIKAEEPVPGGEAEAHWGLLVGESSDEVAASSSGGTPTAYPESGEHRSTDS